MAHYAFLNENNQVTRVIVGKDETEPCPVAETWEDYYSQIEGEKCVRTSYNTSAGEHSTGGTPFRKNYAAAGYTYDAARDAFIPPRPSEDAVLDEATCLWIVNDEVA